MYFTSNKVIELSVNSELSLTNYKHVIYMTGPPLKVIRKFFKANIYIVDYTKKVLC